VGGACRGLALTRAHVLTLSITQFLYVLSMLKWRARAVPPLHMQMREWEEDLEADYDDVCAAAPELRAAHGVTLQEFKWAR
jgi:Mlc titration factor MtfA (ptsG expression regulator)